MQFVFCSHLIISGNVTRTVGGVFFDHDRFPNAHQMVSEMTFDGFRVSTSVLPVVEQEGIPFTEGTKARAFLMSMPKQVGGSGGGLGGERERQRERGLMLL